MRIFDRIASGETVYLQDGSSPTDLQILWRKAANSYNRLVADESAQFIFQSNRADWSIKAGDFGVLMPPFTNMWIEWQTPTFRHMNNEWRRLAQNRIAAKVNYTDDSMWIEAVVAHSGSRIGMMPIAQEVVHYGDLSQITTSITAMQEIAYLRDPMVDTEDHEIYALGLSIELWPALLAIGWLNCRNINTSLASTPSAIKRKRRRKGQPLGLDYRRIQLDESTALALRNNADHEHDPKRLHIVRGHMRTYTAERPAFGTYVGNMWIHQHIRGDSNLGRVNHEYHLSRGSQ